ncbi:hypothetical protein [Burkholderia gladioli]|uniref:hypothetical protein n=1 Tax=Burkholderia gladioli TaxID=28095 RepID=UPI0016418CB6|nr:hypothetical protein [Burkholderia gladioli]
MNVIARLAGALRASLARAPGGQPGPIGLDDAPEDWRAYAERVSRCVSEALDAPDDGAAATPGSRVLLDSYALGCAAAGVAAPTLRLRTWLDARGRIARVETSAGGAAGELDAALSVALLGRPVGATPPRGMPQPVLVRLGFAPAA